MKPKHELLKWKQNWFEKKLLCKVQSGAIRKERIQLRGTKSSVHLLICDVIFTVFNAYKKKGV